MVMYAHCQQIQITGFEDGDVFFFLSSGDALRFFFSFFFCVFPGCKALI